MPTPDSHLAEIGQRQAGVFTRRQALHAGFTPDKINSRLVSRQWRVLHPSVYCANTTKETREARAVGALLHCGVKAMFSHLTAARLLGFEVPLLPNALWLSIPHHHRARKRPGVAIVRTRHLPAEPVFAHGQPVTPPARTVVDLARLLSAERLTHLLYDLARRRVLLPEDVLREAECFGRRVGVTKLRSVLASFDPAFESGLEAEAAGHFVAAGIELEPQVEVWDGWLLLARLDLADRERKLAVEIDGYRWHSGRYAQDRDARRDRELRRRGWTVCRFTTDDVRHRPLDMVRDVHDCMGAIDRGRLTGNPLIPAG